VHFHRQLPGHRQKSAAGLEQLEFAAFDVALEQVDPLQGAVGDELVFADPGMSRKSSAARAMAES